MSMGVCSPSPVLAPRVLCLSRVCVVEPRGLKVVGCGAVCLSPDPSLTPGVCPFLVGLCVALGSPGPHSKALALEICLRTGKGVSG